MPVAGDVISAADLGFSVFDVEPTDEALGATYTAGANVCGVVFTVPPSGKIKVTVSARFQTEVVTSRGVVSTQCREGNSIGSGTIFADTSDDQSLENPATDASGTEWTRSRLSASRVRYIEGLTPGQVSNAQVMVKAFSGAAGIRVFHREILVEGCAS